MHSDRGSEERARSRQKRAESVHAVLAEESQGDVVPYTAADAKWARNAEVETPLSARHVAARLETDTPEKIGMQTAARHPCLKRLYI